MTRELRAFAFFTLFVVLTISCGPAAPAGQNSVPTYDGSPNPSGIGVITAARVREQAEPGEVLVSSTVHDLVAGSGIAFADRGVRTLKGVPGEWRLFTVNA